MIDESSADQTIQIVQGEVSVGSVLTCIVLSVRTRHILTEWKTVLVCGAMFPLGLAPYLYEPVASMTNPPVNWAYARTVDGFIHLLTRGQYERIYPTANPGRFLEQHEMYTDITVAEFGLLYSLVALVPLFYLRRLGGCEPKWLMGLLAVYLTTVFFLLIVLNPSTDRSSRETCRVVYSASHLMLAVCTGYGLVLLGVLFSTSPRLNKSVTLPNDGI